MTLPSALVNHNMTGDAEADEGVGHVFDHHFGAQYVHFQTLQDWLLECAVQLQMEMALMCEREEDCQQAALGVVDDVAASRLLAGELAADVEIVGLAQVEAAHESAPFR